MKELLRNLAILAVFCGGCVAYSPPMGGQYDPYAGYGGMGGYQTQQPLRSGVEFLKQGVSEQNCPQEYPNCYTKDMRLDVRTTENGNTFSGEAGMYAPGTAIRLNSKPTQPLAPARTNMQQQEMYK